MRKMSSEWSHFDNSVKWYYKNNAFGILLDLKWYRKQKTRFNVLGLGLEMKFYRFAFLCERLKKIEKSTSHIISITFL